MWKVSSTNFKAVFSPNLKFVVGLTPSKFLLYRDRTLIWSRKVKKEPCEVINVANNGAFIIKYPDELYLYTIDGDEVFLNPILKEGFINQVALIPKGDKLFFERRTKPSGLLGVFAKDRVQQEIGLINLATGQEGIIFSQVGSPNELAEAKVAFGLGYLALMDRKKNLLKLISLSNFKVEFEIELRDTSLKFFDVSPKGSLLLWLEEATRKSIFIRHYTGMKYRVPIPPQEYEYVTFGKNFIVFLNSLSGELVFQNFKGELIYKAPLSKLDDIKISNWTIFFPSEEDIITVYFVNDRAPLVISYYDIQTFETEIKRWEMEYEKIKMESQALEQMLTKKEPEKEKLKLDLDQLEERTSGSELKSPSDEAKPAPKVIRPKVEAKLGPSRTTEEELLRSIQALEGELEKSEEAKEKEGANLGGVGAKDSFSQLREAAKKTPPSKVAERFIRPLVEVEKSKLRASEEELIKALKALEEEKPPKEEASLPASPSRKTPALDYDEPPKKAKGEVEIDLALGGSSKPISEPLNKVRRAKKLKSIDLESIETPKSPRRGVEILSKGPKEMKKVNLEKILDQQIKAIDTKPKEKIELDLDLETGEVKVKKEKVEVETTPGQGAETAKKKQKLSKSQIMKEIQKLRMLRKIGEISDEEYAAKLKELKSQLEALKKSKR